MSRTPSRSPARPADQADQDTKEKNLLLLFDRPGEPLFLPRNDDNAVFDIPTNYLVRKIT